MPRRKLGPIQPLPSGPGTTTPTVPIGPPQAPPAAPQPQPATETRETRKITRTRRKHKRPHGPRVTFVGVFWWLLTIGVVAFFVVKSCEPAAPPNNPGITSTCAHTTIGAPLDQSLESLRNFNGTVYCLPKGHHVVAMYYHTDGGTVFERLGREPVKLNDDGTFHLSVDLPDDTPVRSNAALTFVEADTDRALDKLLSQKRWFSSDLPEDVHQIQDASYPLNTDY